MAIYKKDLSLPLMMSSENEATQVYKERFTYKDEAESQVYDYLEMLVPEEWEDFSVTQQHQYTWCYFNDGSYQEMSPAHIRRCEANQAYLLNRF